LGKNTTPIISAVIGACALGMVFTAAAQDTSPLQTNPQQGITIKGTTTLPPDLLSLPCWPDQVKGLEAIAIGASGKKSRSTLLEKPLPRYIFKNSVAQTLGEQRCLLSRDVRKKDGIANTLETILKDKTEETVTPEIYLALYVAYNTLIHARNHEDLRVIALMWDIMLHLEEDQLTEGERNLHAAQDTLRQAQEKNISPEELGKHAENAQKAMEDYFREQQKIALENPEKALSPEALENLKKILEEQREMMEKFKKMKEEIKNIDPALAKQMAQQMAENLQQQMQNMQDMEGMKPPEQAQSENRPSAMEKMRQQQKDMAQQTDDMQKRKDEYQKLQELVKEQQALLNETIEMKDTSITPEEMGDALERMDQKTQTMQKMQKEQRKSAEEMVKMAEQLQEQQNLPSQGQPENRKMDERDLMKKANDLLEQIREKKISTPQRQKIEQMQKSLEALAQENDPQTQTPLSPEQRKEMQEQIEKITEEIKKIAQEIKEKTRKNQEKLDDMQQQLDDMKKQTDEAQKQERQLDQKQAEETLEKLEKMIQEMKEMKKDQEGNQQQQQKKEDDENHEEKEEETPDDTLTAPQVKKLINKIKQTVEGLDDYYQGLQQDFEQKNNDNSKYLDREKQQIENSSGSQEINKTIQEILRFIEQNPSPENDPIRKELEDLEQKLDDDNINESSRIDYPPIMVASADPHMRLGLTVPESVDNITPIKNDLKKIIETLQKKNEKESKIREQNNVIIKSIRHYIDNLGQRLETKSSSGTPDQNALQDITKEARKILDMLQKLTDAPQLEQEDAPPQEQQSNPDIEMKQELDSEVEKLMRELDHLQDTDAQSAVMKMKMKRQEQQHKTDPGLKQQNLKQKLQNLKEGMQKGMKPLDDAEDSMEGATKNLGEGNPDGAIPKQKDALQSMQDAAGEMKQQMMQQMQGAKMPGGKSGENPGKSKEREQVDIHQGETDPLGRKIEQTPPGAGDVPEKSAPGQSKKIEEIIHEKLSDPALPPKDRRFLEQIIKGFSPSP